MPDNGDSVTAADVQHLQYKTHPDMLSLYAEVATYTILVYDYLVTFGREKDLVWPMPIRSPVKILFFLTRYMSFFDLGFSMWCHFTVNMTASGCSIGYKAIGYSIIFGFVVAEATLSLRTWAVWSRSRAIAVCLSAIFTSVWGANIVITAIFLESIKFTPLPYNIPGCFASSGSFIIAIDWVLGMIYEIFILVLMSIKAFTTYRLHGHSHMYKTIYRDGSLFYVYLSAISIINVIIIVTLPTDLATILSNFSRVIHSVLTGRIIMSLRALGMRSWDGESQAPALETIQFAHKQMTKNTELTSMTSS